MKHHAIDLLRSIALIAAALLCRAAGAAPGEVDALLARLLQAPVIAPAAGYAASMMVAPGQLYDPLWLHRHGEEMCSTTTAAKKERRAAVFWR